MALRAEPIVAAGERPSTRAGAYVEWAILAVLAVGWSATAWVVSPFWDDGFVWLASRALSLDELRLTYADRPIHGWIETHLVAANLTREVSVVAHALVWLGIGALTTVLGRRLFPRHPRQAFLAGIVAMSPIFVTTQLVLVNATWSGNLPTLLAWGPLLLLWPDWEREPRAGQRLLRAVGLCVGAVAYVLGCLLSEYAVSAALAGGTLLAVLGLRREAGVRSWKPGALLIGITLIVYGLFRRTIHDGFREIGPSHLAQHLGQRVMSFPFFLATSVWQALGGVTLSRVGGIRIVGSGMERVTALAVAVAVVAFAAAARRLGAERDDSTEALDPIHTDVALVAGVVAGIVPFCLTARVPGDDSTSRYFTPIIPILAVLSLSVLRRLFRGTKAVGIAPAVLVGAAAYWSVTNAGAAIKDRHRVRQWARELEPHLAGGPTLVVLTSTTPWPPYTRNYELTARLRQDLRGDSARHLWVAREIPATDTELNLVPASPEAHSPPRLTVGWYHVQRVEESLARIVWASVGSDGKLTMVDQDY